MAKDASFDIVSELDMQEVTNAVLQTMKEIETRFDFKGSKSSVEFDGKELTLLSDDEFKLAALYDVLQSKCVKRNVSLKALKPGKVEAASGGTVRQKVALQQGIETDKAKAIVKLIKDSKLKVQVSIQGDQVRVSAKSRDDLQSVIAAIREADFDIPLQFTNYR
ncbi:YajQ family cyclic di-GMP-binding protein [Alicyclobacillus curvatus]|nr:YajQ family cyclic di-GMP-binding protein [Alicyclobacillus curvatus]